MKLSGVSQIWYTLVSLVRSCIRFLFYHCTGKHFSKNLCVHRHIGSKQLTLKWTGLRTSHG